MTDWLANKPKKNDGSLPVLKVNWKDMPTIAEGIWHAQAAGWDRILTYDYVRNTQERRRQRRFKRSQIENDGFQRCGLTADEYPFACTKENAGSTFLTNAPGGEQSKQGGVLNAFFREHGVYTRANELFYFEVQVVGYFHKPRRPA